MLRKAVVKYPSNTMYLLLEISQNKKGRRFQ